MNWDIIEGKWTQLKASVREKWSDITDDDADEIAGDRDRLAGKLQERYGWAKEKVDTEINEFFSKHS